ncbi:MAG: hypothetical protein WBM77_07360 [Maribacter sp.]|jgi:hypothetical protein
MKTAELEVVKKRKQNIRLVDGEFTASEASFVVQALLDEKINFHKLQRLSMLEGDCNTKTTFDTGRIAELENEKVVAKEFFSQIRQQGLKLQIKGNLEIIIANPS